MNKKIDSAANYLDQTDDLILEAPKFYSLKDLEAADMDQLRIEFMRISPSFSYLNDQVSQSEQELFDGFKSLYIRNLETIKQRSLVNPKSKKLSKEDEKHIEAVFAKMLNTHAEYGDIHRRYFDWYADKGRYIFDNWTNREDVKFLGTSNHPGISNLSDPKVMSEALQYIKMIANNQAWPKTVLIAVPTSLPKRIAIEHTTFLIQMHYDMILKIQGAKYRRRKLLAVKRERPDALVKKLKLLICKAFYPKRTLWQLGEMVEFSSSYRDKKLDQTKDKPNVALMKSELAAHVNRAIRAAQYIAEHASIDNFPVQSKVITPYYDWDDIKAKILRAHPNLSI